jgi:hypothetical protein
MLSARFSDVLLTDVNKVNLLLAGNWCVVVLYYPLFLTCKNIYSVESSPQRQ